MTTTSFHATIPNRRRRLLGAALVAAILLTGVGLTQASTAQAAGVPGVPKYTYRMVNVYQSASRYRSTALSSVLCNNTPNAGSTTYSTAVTTSNNFSYTGGLSFPVLSGLFTPNLSISGGVTSSTTTTESLTVNLNPGQCAQVFALRNAYSYTLQRRCNLACTNAEYAAPGGYLTMGTGSYTKVVGRGFYLV